MGSQRVGRRLTRNIDCGGISVGTDEHPFKGTFDGDGHTLTFNAGTEYNPLARAASPFYRVSEATFRHLHTAGKVCISAQYTGGIISQVFGSKATRLFDCNSSITIFSTIRGDASNGGLVGKRTPLNAGAARLIGCYELSLCKIEP